MKILVLDDDIMRHDGFKKNLKDHDVTHTFTVTAAQWHLNNFHYDILYLDHDLGTEEEGIDLVNYIVNNLPSESFKVVVHSWNPAGARNMTERLIASGFYAIQMKFGNSLFDWIP